MHKENNIFLTTDRQSASAKHIFRGKIFKWDDLRQQKPKQKLGPLAQVENEAAKAAHMSGLMPQVSGKCQVFHATWPPEEEQPGDGLENKSM